jgi:hypothetical protein
LCCSSISVASIHAQRVFAGQEHTYHLSKFIAKYHTAAFMLNAPAYSNELTQMMLGLDLKVNSLHHLFSELGEYHVPIMQADILASQQNEPVDHAGLTQSEYLRLSARHVAQKPAAKVVKPPTKFELVHIVERIELFCVGLCLDCLKGNDKCRVRHTDHFDENLWIPHRHMGCDGDSDFGEDTKRPADWQSIW